MLYEHEEYIFQYLDTYMATEDGMHMSYKGHKNYYCERIKKTNLSNTINGSWEDGT